MVWMPGAMAPEPRFTELTVGEFHASQLAGRAVGKDEKRKLKEKSKAVTDWGITDSQRAFLTDACDGFETRLLGPGEGADRHFGVDLSKWSGFQVI